MNFTLKSTLALSLLVAGNLSVQSQTLEEFDISIEEITIECIPGLQSYVVGTYDNKWLFIGGRTDGLHQRQPFAAFQAADNNVMAYVVDPVENECYSASLSALPQSMYEQLQSTNMEYEQRDNMLYITGGYGYSATENDHHTYPNLCAVTVPDLMNAIIDGESITPFFRQITDARLQVTGGYLDRLGDTYYLAGGQQFEGRYNPMGPTHGQGFYQDYTDAIKKFEIVDDGTNLSIANYSEWVDSVNLHRRDYNMSPQIFPNGEHGFTLFSGVFQHDADLPWLNTVDLVDTGYTPRNDFNQYLNQYHSAHLPIWDGTNQAMHTVFFGGISRYTLDENDQLVDDPDVPFVNTISKIVRLSDNSMEESKIGEMPGLLGSGAEFIPIENTAWYDEQAILLLSAIPAEKVLIGYVVGGIESSAPNIFRSNTGTQSDASTRVFEVYLYRGAPSSVEIMNGEHYFNANIYPNPAHGSAELSFSIPDENEVWVELYDTQGKLIRSLFEGIAHESTLKIATNDLDSGIYVVKLRTAQYERELKLSVMRN